MHEHKKRAIPYQHLTTREKLHTWSDQLYLYQSTKNLLYCVPPARHSTSTDYTVPKYKTLYYYLKHLYTDQRSLKL